MLKIVFTLLRSATMTIVILSLLLVCCLLPTILPQSTSPISPEIKAWQSEHPDLFSLFHTLQLFDIFASPLFYSLLGLFFVNLLLCTIETCWSKTWKLNIPPWHREGIKPWGGMLTHFGMLLMCIALFLDDGWGSKGQFIVKENMHFPAPDLFGYFHYGFLHSEETKGKLPTFDFSLYFQNLTVEYQWNGKVNTRCDFGVQVYEKGIANQATISPLNPLETGRYIITMDRYGFAPNIIVNKGSQTLINGPCPMYGFLKAQDRSQESWFHLPDKLMLKIELTPDAGEIDTANFRVTTRSYVPRNPVFVFTLMQEKNLLGKTSLTYPPGSPKPVFAKIGNYDIGVSNIEYWAKFYITSHPAETWVYAGMWLSCLGAALVYGRLIFAKI